MANVDKIISLRKKVKHRERILKDVLRFRGFGKQVKAECPHVTMIKDFIREEMKKDG